MNVRIALLLVTAFNAFSVGAQTCDELINRGDYDTALMTLEKTADDSSVSPEKRSWACLRAAIVQLRNLGDCQRARVTLEKAVALNPGDKRLVDACDSITKELEQWQDRPLFCKYNLNKPEAIFQSGEDIALTVRVCGENADDVKFVKCERLANGQVTSIAIVPVEGRIFKTSARAATGSWVMFNVEVLDKDKKPPNDKVDPVSIGAMVEPETIQEAVKTPEDFAEFWREQRRQLSQVPLNAQRTEIASSCSRAKQYDVKVDCAGPAPVSGCLSIPVDSERKSFPAMVTFHGAGVNSAEKPPFWQHPENTIIFDINAHGIENFKPLDFYLVMNRPGGQLFHYYYKNMDNRDTYYMKDIFVRVMRALDYVKSLPEWDGKTLIAFGGSQGGAQSLVAAALDPEVTLCVATVPAMGDLAGAVVSRQPGWPAATPKDKLVGSKELACLAYYDMKNFARLVKCEAYLATGFIDTACSPSSVFLIYNSLPKNTKIAMSTTPDVGHGASNTKGFLRLQKILNGAGSQ